MECNLVTYLVLVTPRIQYSLRWIWRSLRSYKDRQKVAWLVWLWCRWIFACCIRWLVKEATRVEGHKWPQTGARTRRRAEEQVPLSTCSQCSILAPLGHHDSSRKVSICVNALTPSKISHLWVLESSEPGSSLYSSKGMRSYSACSTILRFKACQL